MFKLTTLVAAFAVFCVLQRATAFDCVSDFDCANCAVCDDSPVCAMNLMGISETFTNPCSASCAGSQYLYDGECACDGDYVYEYPEYK